MAFEGRPATLIEYVIGVDPERSVGIDEYEVRVPALTHIASLVHAKNVSRRVTRTIHKQFDTYLPCGDEIEQGQ